MSVEHERRDSRRSVKAVAVKEEMFVVERVYCRSCPWTFERKLQKRNNSESCITGRRCCCCRTRGTWRARAFWKRPAIRRLQQRVRESRTRLGTRTGSEFHARKCCPWWRELHAPYACR